MSNQTQTQTKSQIKVKKIKVKKLVVVADPSKPSGKEMGLIKHLSTRNTQLKWEGDKSTNLMKTALNMLWVFGIRGADTTQPDMVAHYILDTGEFCGYKNVMSYIGNYTNKKGVTTLAHYNPNNTYIGSVKKLGDKPVACKILKRLCRDNGDTIESIVENYVIDIKLGWAFQLKSK